MELIGIRLKNAIKGKGLTVADAANTLGISRQTLSAYFKHSEFEDDFLQNVKTSLGIDLFPFNIQSVKTTPFLAEGSSGGSGKLVPYYDLDVTAGNFAIFSGESKEHVSSMVRVPSMMDVDAFVNVSGSSMRDKYCSGDIIGIKRIDHANFIEWGEAHVVITRDDRRLFKYVRKSEDKEYIVLRSENREENDDIDLPVSLVVSMFIVKGLIRRKAM